MLFRKRKNPETIKQPEPPKPAIFLHDIVTHESVEGEGEVVSITSPDRVTVFFNAMGCASIPVEECTLVRRRDPGENDELIRSSENFKGITINLRQFHYLDYRRLEHWCRFSDITEINAHHKGIILNLNDYEERNETFVNRRFSGLSPEMCEFIRDCRQLDISVIVLELNDVTADTARHNWVEEQQKHWLGVVDEPMLAMEIERLAHNSYDAPDGSRAVPEDYLPSIEDALKPRKTSRKDNEHASPDD